MRVEKAPVPFNDLARMDTDLRYEITEAAARVIASGWYVMGPEHKAFEQELASFIGVESAALVANGTDALVLALLALGTTSDDLVLTCANAGGYTTTACRLVGAIPVYADVDPSTHLLTAETVRAGIESAYATYGRKPSVIVVTHLYGASANITQITEWAHAQGISVVEDCAQAFGGFSGKNRLGSIADISTTSFYPTKNLGAIGDAGAIFTNRTELDTRVRSLRQYGWSTKYRTTVQGGMNSRCDELQAAILRIKLRRLDGWNARRREIHALYERALSSSTTARLLNSVEGEFVGHLAVLVVDDRESAIKIFNDHGIKTDIHYPICDHQQPTAPEGSYSLPASEYAAEHIISIPLFAELEEHETDRVAEALRAI
ncbi:DegT/DnrJ/EryC1/StrS family aminotransferase [Lysinibacter sp. HNR]|uniref:DegT/DnrJ/EryC1/StrS family aminotransferase n=1 Tax=Lysinibacter sp. HNR TaxID=3031408 RepID=UPI00243583BD|nr:DegT/DnrJ/EryC1/StrS family aminotransferase [Lysinibacter sp. HNR]WGD38065.1 DegT/DnrJ/EryC1/StrS family aminotransferase [Lysinibacter sp. HNR]